MEQVSVEAARERLAELIEAALRGERVVIDSDETHSVQLVPVVRHAEPRVPGSAHGLIEMSPDFDAPLDDFDPYTR